MPSTPSSTSRLPVYLLFAILVFGCALRIYYFDSAMARTPDERTYTRQADIVLAQGVSGYHVLGQELADDLPEVSLYPSPMRVGYITLLTGFMGLTGDSSILAGAHLSLLCSMISLCLIAFIAYRFLTPAVAVTATLSLAVFPFDLVVSRRSWEESFISLLTLAMLALAAYIASTDSKRVACVAGFALLGFLAMATKENSGVAFLLCAAALILHLILQHDRRAAMLVAASAATAMLAYVAVLGALFGGVANALTLVRAYLHYSGTNPYGLQYESGTVLQFLAGLFHASPFLFIAALAGLAVTLYRMIRSRSTAEAGLPLGIVLIAVGVPLIQIVTQRYNYRFTAPAFGPLCLLAGIGIAAALPRLQRVLAPLGRVTVWVVVGLVLAVAAGRDLNFAQEKLLGPEVQDLALRPVLGLPPNLLSPAIVQAASAPPAASNIDALQAAVQNDPTAANRINLSQAYINANTPAPAVPVLEAVIAADPKNLIAWNNLCVAYTMLKEYNPAIGACERAVQIDPTFQLAKNNLAWARDEMAKAKK